jgi:hypothetical protein
MQCTRLCEPKHGVLSYCLELVTPADLEPGRLPNAHSWRILLLCRSDLARPEQPVIAICSCLSREVNYTSGSEICAHEYCGRRFEGTFTEQRACAGPRARDGRPFSQQQVKLALHDSFSETNLKSPEKSKITVRSLEQCNEMSIQMTTQHCRRVSEDGFCSYREARMESIVSK